MALKMSKKTLLQFVDECVKEREKLGSVAKTPESPSASCQDHPGLLTRKRELSKKGEDNPAPKKHKKKEKLKEVIDVEKLSLENTAIFSIR